MNSKRLNKKYNDLITQDFRKRKYGIGCSVPSAHLSKFALLKEVDDWKRTDPDYKEPYQEPFSSNVAFSYYSNYSPCPVVSGGDLSKYELVANKSQDFTIIDNTHYPSTEAVLNFISNIEDDDQILVTTDW